MPAKMFILGVVAAGIAGSLLFQSYFIAASAAVCLVLAFIFYYLMEILNEREWNNGFCPRCGCAWVVDHGTGRTQGYFCPSCEGGRGPGRRRLALCRVNDK